MYIMHLALGGCLKAPPVRYGLTEDTGGHIAYVLGAAQAQAMQGDRVDIVTRAFHDPDLDPIHALPTEIVDRRTRILRLTTRRKAYLAKEELEAELPALRAAFLGLLRGMTTRPDVLHAHFADAAEIALAARARFGIPVLYTPHSLGLGKAPEHGGDPVHERRIARERRAIAEADAIVVSSRDEAESQVPGYGVATAEGRTHRVNPGANVAPASEGVARARALLAPHLVDPDKPLILAIARPVPKKNLHALLMAYARTPGLVDAANLAIVAGVRREGQAGACTDQAAVQRRLADDVRRLGLGGRVALPPDHGPDDVPQLYRLAARTGGVFVNPALHEPFGLTLLEAAAAGLPVVATDRGGPRDILRDLNHGQLVDPTDVAALGAACLRAVTDKDAHAAWAAGPSRAVVTYDWPTWARRVAGICAELGRPVATPARRSGKASGSTGIGLVACDIDGTLTGSRAGAGRFADWAARRDVAYVVATGRSLTEARRVLAVWNLPRPDLYITSVGSEIWRPDAEGRLVPDRTYAEAISEGWDAEAVAEVLRAGGATAQDAADQRLFKRSYVGDLREAARLVGLLRNAGLAANVVASHGRLIDVLPQRAGKAAALDHVARGMGLTLRNCVACGDSANDACMLRVAGQSILVGNALPEVSGLSRARRLIRARADHADGVLEGLAALGLHRDAGPRTDAGRHQAAQA